MSARESCHIDPELAALAALSDEDIDTSDIPETTDWSKGTRGKFYRPLKQVVTIRLDADVVAWLKAKGPGYQTRINTVLRTVMVKSASSSEAEFPARNDRVLSFPSLERHGELDRYSHLASVIEERGSLFAPVC